MDLINYFEKIELNSTQTSGGDLFFMNLDYTPIIQIKSVYNQNTHKQINFVHQQFKGCAKIQSNNQRISFQSFSLLTLDSVFLTATLPIISDSLIRICYRVTHILPGPEYTGTPGPGN